MGNVGVFPQIFKFFFARDKSHQVIYADSIPLDPLTFGGEILKPNQVGSLLNAYKGAIYAVTNIRANNLAALPLRVYLIKSTTEKSAFSARSYDHPLMVTRAVTRKRKDEIFSKAIPGSRLSAAADIEEVVKHPLSELLRKVNPRNLNGFDLVHLTSASLDLTGNCYWILLRNPLGVPAAIHVVSSEWMSIIPGEDDLIKAYKYKRGSVEIEYPPEDVVHTKYVTPASMFYGTGHVAAARQAHDLREFMINYEQQMFKTGGLPKQILMTKNKISKADAETLKTKWKQTAPGDIAVLWGQEFELVEPRYATARDMGYADGLKFTLTEIAQIWGVPKSMLDTTDVNLANAKSGERQLAKLAIEPSAMRIDQKITEQLAPQFDDNLFAMFDNPVKEDEETAREDRKVNIELGITTRNEERRQQGMEDVEHGDELLVPANLVPISEISDNMTEAEAQFLAGRATEIARERRP